MKKLLAALLVATSSLPASAELLTNGGFEAGNFTGWSLSGDTSYTGVGGGEGVPVAEGNYAGFFGSTGGLTYLTQTVDTDVGATYTLNFKLRNNGGTPSSFSVSLGGETLMSQSNANSFDYTDFSFSQVATSSTTALGFTFSQVPAFYYLDAVSLEETAPAAEVPEPAMLGLFGMGAIGLGLSRRRRAA